MTYYPCGIIVSGGFPWTVDGGEDTIFEGGEVMGGDASYIFFGHSWGGVGGIIPSGPWGPIRRSGPWRFIRSGPVCPIGGGGPWSPRRPVGGWVRCPGRIVERGIWLFLWKDKEERGSYAEREKKVRIT